MAVLAEGFVSVENDPYRRFAPRLRCSAADAECRQLTLYSSPSTIRTSLKVSPRCLNAGWRLLAAFHGGRDFRRHEIQGLVSVSPMSSGRGIPRLPPASGPAFDKFNPKALENYAAEIEPRWWPWLAPVELCPKGFRRKECFGYSGACRYP
jgi:hypothetical protein